MAEETNDAGFQDLLGQLAGLRALVTVMVGHVAAATDDPRGAIATARQQAIGMLEGIQPVPGREDLVAVRERAKAVVNEVCSAIGLPGDGGR